MAAAIPLLQRLRKAGFNLQIRTGSLIVAVLLGRAVAPLRLPAAGRHAWRVS